MGMTTVFDPTGAREGHAAAQAPIEVTLSTLTGKTVGIRHDKLWASFDWVTDEWAQALRGDGATVVTWMSDERTGKEGARVAEAFDEFTDSIDAAVVGLASCGSCTMLTVADTVAAADKGLPAVAVCTEQFEPLAHMLATRDGRGNLPMTVLPFPLETRPESEVRDIARQAYPSLLEALGITPS
jgi:hypothetical protein